MSMEEVLDLDRIVKISNILIKKAEKHIASAELTQQYSVTIITIFPMQNNYKKRFI